MGSTQALDEEWAIRVESVPHVYGHPNSYSGDGEKDGYGDGRGGHGGGVTTVLVLLLRLR